ncbi:MAG: tetratricopeptide repeat protein [Candidatus Zixiibacteriota bacterium]|nr:MAG: tetratricopeptide repeat protein [candidate division Zixibacteria bacterium]
MLKPTMFCCLLISAMLLAVQCGKRTQDIDELKEDAALALDGGDFSRALSSYRRAYRLEPSDRDVLFGLGMAYKRILMPESALVYFRRAKILYRHDRAVNRELLQLCPAAEDYQCAINAINALIATGDNERMYWPLLADYYYRVQDFAAAVKYYQLLIAENQDDRLYYLHLSGALSYMQDFEQSNEILLQAVERFGPTGETLANIAVNYINLKQFDLAEKYFRESLQFNPDHVPTWINLANVLSSRESRAKKQEALEIYKRYKPQTPAFYNIDSLIKAMEIELGVE